MALILDVASWLCLGTGALALLVGSIGINRMPDFYTRLHPAGITDTLGAGLVLLGLGVQAGLTLVAVKLLLIFLFLMLTSPTASHATARAALATALRPKLGRNP